MSSVPDPHMGSTTASGAPAPAVADAGGAAAAAGRGPSGEVTPAGGAHPPSTVNPAA